MGGVGHGGGLVEDGTPGVVVQKWVWSSDQDVE